MSCELSATLHPRFETTVTLIYKSTACISQYAFRRFSQFIAFALVDCEHSWISNLNWTHIHIHMYVTRIYAYVGSLHDVNTGADAWTEAT